jgi:hypothetical protein
MRLLISCARSDFGKDQAASLESRPMHPQSILCASSFRSTDPECENRVSDLLSVLSQTNLQVELCPFSLASERRRFLRMARSVEADLERSWALDPVVVAETKDTRKVHGKRQVLN